MIVWKYKSLYNEMSLLYWSGSRLKNWNIKKDHAVWWFKHKCLHSTFVMIKSCKVINNTALCSHPCNMVLRSREQKANLKNVCGHNLIIIKLKATQYKTERNWIANVMFCGPCCLYCKEFFLIKFILSTLHARPEKDCPGFELWPWPWWEPRARDGPAFGVCCEEHLLFSRFHFQFNSLCFLIL